MNYENIANFIDYSVLVPQSKAEEIVKVCMQAKEHGFKAVCVNSGNVSLVAKELKGSEVLVCSTVGFPLGAVSTKVKVFETEEAIQNGADEIDMVINIGKLKDADYSFVKNDIAAVAQICKTNNKVLKVILETCLLTDEEKIIGCKLAVEAGAQFVKTSTGFSFGGATEADVRLMRETVGPNIGVKASAQITTHEIGVSMLKAGASRLGSKDGMIVMK